jgi:hypothetical protein
VGDIVAVILISAASMKHIAGSDEASAGSAEASAYLLVPNQTVQEDCTAFYQEQFLVWEVLFPGTIAVVDGQTVSRRDRLKLKEQVGRVF